MITRITKFKIEKASLKDFEDFMKTFRDEIISIEGCRHFDILKDKDDENNLFMFMIWKDDEYLETFRKSDLNKLIVNKLKIFSAKEPSNWTVETVFDPDQLSQQKSLFD
jgi:quinol monooxygenase YgiN